MKRYGDGPIPDPHYIYIHTRMYTKYNIGDKNVPLYTPRFFRFDEAKKNYTGCPKQKTPTTTWQHVRPPWSVLQIRIRLDLGIPPKEPISKLEFYQLE